MMTAALPATASALVRPIDAVGIMPRGLTDIDGERIAAAIAAARTESTRRVYAGVWSRWERWCASRGVAVLPSDPLAVCAYLTEQAADGRAMGTLDLICTVIRHVHRMCDLHNPTDALAVHQVRRGLRRTYGSAPRRLARPLSVEEIRQIVDGIDRATPIGIRDAAIILLGYASALRRSELVALALADIEDKPAGLLLHIRRSKTDPEGHGAVVGVAHGQHAATDPVAALNAWRNIRGAAPGPVFTRIWRAPSASNRSPDTSPPECSGPEPKPPGSTAPGSPPTRCVPATPRPPHSPASHWTGSLRRPGTRTSPSSSTATSGPSKPSQPPRARTSVCEVRSGGRGIGQCYYGPGGEDQCAEGQHPGRLPSRDEHASARKRLAEDCETVKTLTKIVAELSLELHQAREELASLRQVPHIGARSSA